MKRIGKAMQASARYGENIALLFWECMRTQRICSSHNITRQPMSMCILGI